MARRPNAANITHGLAQLGGGSKKEGGSGMMGGMQTIFKTAYMMGHQDTLDGKYPNESLEVTQRDYIEKK
nr:hypothetical protein [uncultured Butyrivibrio sp.]